MFPSKTPELPQLAARNPRQSLRLRLTLLVVGTCLPLILFTAGLVYLNYTRDREDAFDQVLTTVKAMRLVLDAKMQGMVTALDVLASSNAIQKNDMNAFRKVVDSFVSKFEGSAIAMGDGEGNQLFNSGVPAGQPLPRRTNLESIERVFKTGQPAFSNLFIGSVTGRRLITVSVPVRRDGKIVSDLSFVVPLSLFQDILTEQSPQGWTVSFFDRTGTNFARVPNPEQTIGQKASPTLLPSLLTLDEAKLPTTSLEGVPLITALTRSALTGWTVAAGTPVATLTDPLWRGLTISIGIGLVLLSIGLAFAIGMAARIARSESLLALMVNELNHRVKNTLAMVQSIASQTFRSGSDPVDQTRKFDERLRALGNVYNVLSEERWGNADVRAVVRDALGPFASDERHRVVLSGPEIRLAPRTALMVSLVLHELATNATKYGALSQSSGTVSIVWEKAGEDRIKLVWREHGGPSIVPPERKGFGTRLIEQGFPAQLGGQATLEYLPDGLICTLECPRTPDAGGA